MIDSVITWKWDKPGYRSRFTSDIVNALRRDVARYYPHPHRFICITDDPSGLDDGIERVPLWTFWGGIENPTWGAKGPSCYRRLAAFHPDFEQIAGKRFVSLDLDVVIVDDLTPLWNRPEDFVITKAVAGEQIYNGSMFMMTAGSKRRVYDRFDPERSPQMTAAEGLRGTDQAWIQYALGPHEATWSAEDGVFGYRVDCVRKLRGGLPRNARIVMFWGKPDPWDPEAQQQSPWIAKARSGTLTHDDRADPVQPKTKLIADIALKHAGRKIVVMGGGPSLPEDLKRCPTDALYISANEHGAMLRKCDYIIAIDDIERKLRRFGVPIIGRREFCDYRIQDWEDCLELNNSGRAGAWVAALLGGSVVILAGMDCYACGTYHHDVAAKSTGNGKSLDEHMDGWRRLAERLKSVHVRTCGGPTSALFPLWRDDESFTELPPFAEAIKMSRIEQRIILTRSLARLNHRRVAAGLVLPVSGNEFRSLMRTRKAQEL